MQSVSAIERRTMAKVYMRLLPFCFVLYFICYLDRVNIGFAALTMNKELGLSSYVFGLGAGAFFWGYFILEVPSNLILEKFGARRWIGRIMISWGLVSGAFVFTRGPISFIVLRFSLGLAEAMPPWPIGTPVSRNPASRNRSKSEATRLRRCWRSRRSSAKLAAMVLTFL